MDGEKAKLRMVLLVDGRRGHFHTWTQRAIMTVNTSYVEACGIVELESGDIELIAPSDMKFVERDYFEETIKAVNRRIIKRGGES